MEKETIIENCKRLRLFFGEGNRGLPEIRERQPDCLTLLNYYSNLLDYYGAGSAGPLSLLILNDTDYEELKRFGESNLDGFVEKNYHDRLILNFSFNGYRYVVYKK